MKKISIVATILATVAGLLAGVALYIAVKGTDGNTTIEPLSDASVTESVENESKDASSGQDIQAATGQNADSGQAQSETEGQADADTAQSTGNEQAQSPEADVPADQNAATAEADTQTAPETQATTSTGLDLAAAQAIYNAYIAAVQNAMGDMERGYYIYDIDKDNIPELLLTHEDGTNRGLAVWTYADGQAVYCDVMWGFAHGYPFPASYPDGNGIVLEETAREYECIWVISKNGTSLSDTVRTDNCSVYSENIVDHGIPYYTDIEDNYGTYFNHQYRPYTGSPYFAGSQALGLCDIADDTAIREALGMA